MPAIVTLYIYIPALTANTVTRLNTSDGGGAVSIAKAGAFTSAVNLDTSMVWTTSNNNYVDKSPISLASNTSFNTAISITGVCFDLDGNVWCSEGGSLSGVDNLVKINPSDGSIIAYYEVGTRPYHLTADANGYVWCTNRASNSVSKVKVSDGTVTTYADVATDPCGIAVDLDGNLWVACYSAANVKKISGVDGSVLGTYTTVSSAGCFGIAIDSGNNVWVTNNLTNNMTKLNSAGEVIATYGSTNITGALGVCIDASDNVWVALGGSNYIFKYTNAGTYVNGYACGTTPIFPDTGYAYQHFVLKSDAPVPSTFVPKVIML